MRKVLVLVVAAAMGLSSATFATEATTTSAPTATITKTAPTKTTHHKKQHKAAPVQRAQATKKHHEDMKAGQKTPEQKMQAAKGHVGKHSHQQLAKSATQPTVQAFNSNAGVSPRA